MSLKQAAGTTVQKRHRYVSGTFPEFAYEWVLCTIHLLFHCWSTCCLLSSSSLSLQTPHASHSSLQDCDRKLFLCLTLLPPEQTLISCRWVIWQLRTWRKQTTDAAVCNLGLRGKQIVIKWRKNGWNLTWEQQLQEPPAPPTAFVLFLPFFLVSLLPLLSSIRLPLFSNSCFSSFPFCSPLPLSFLTPLVWEPDEALMESTGSQHLPHLKRTGRSLLLFCPTEGFPRFPSALLSITTISNGFICRKPLTLPSPAPVSHARRTKFSSASLWCTNIQQAPFFCPGTSKATDLSRDNCSRARPEGTTFVWGCRENEKERSDSIIWSRTMDPLCATTAASIQLTSVAVRGGVRVEKHTTFLHSSSSSFDQQVVQNNSKWIWRRPTLDRVGPCKTDNDL